ncbi:MAG TPA: ATP-binding domain-containing protein [Gaiellaceae bacterium]|nr:ATP-binding domain-containing protein [Gaiellaceae bacterium]
MPHPELAQEQAYLDNAYAHLERMRAAVERSVSAADDEVTGLALEAWARRRLETFSDADRGLCFGRLDLDELRRPLYVGRRWVHDDARQVLVVNWQAPAARPFYTATPADPQRVTLRRRFRSQGRTLLEIADEPLDGSALEGAAVSDFLLEELDRTREGRMRDIVATIQADQYRLITAEPEGALVVQGGPGTGKTAVGLHRASWLLFSHRERLRRVLVVGPNPTFMEYVSHVLPALGEEAVEQRAVDELVDGAEATRADAPEAARAKADPAMAALVAAAVEAAIAPRPEELVAYMDGHYVKVREREVAELLEQALSSGLALGPARERFRIELLRRFYRDYGERLGGSAFRSGDEVERALRRGGHLQRWLDRVLPLPKPAPLVRRLLAAEKLPRGGGWSAHDLPLLDEARALLEGPPRAYGHVIVDEAQDLSPMQLRMIARRAAAGLTILGDVAQATGPVLYDRWEELAGHLRVELRIEELRHAYRVPAEIMALALPLLDEIAPAVEPPLAYRTGGTPPRVRRVAERELVAAALAETAALAPAEGLLALIAPPSVAGLLPHGNAFSELDVPVLTPRESKGLEFDHVVVVEPAAIVAEAGAQGLRELYVALTRPTKTLVVVHALPLPAALETAGAATP